MNASFAHVARHLVHPTGGIKTSTSVLPPSCRLIDGSLILECVLLFWQYIKANLYFPCGVIGRTRRREKGETAERDELVQVPHDL